MMRYVALLRGINVGGRIVKMQDLKVTFEGAGFKNVNTVAQTGNVLFESNDSDTSDMRQRIETALTKTYNYPAKVQIVALDSLQKIIADYPFRGRENYHNYVIFLENGLEKDLVREIGNLNNEQIKAGDSVIYWQVEKGKTLKSEIAKLLTKSKYKNFNTTRNLNTLKKLIC